MDDRDMYDAFEQRDPRHSLFRKTGTRHVVFGVYGPYRYPCVAHIQTWLPVRDLDLAADIALEMAGFWFDMVPVVGMPALFWQQNYKTLGRLCLPADHGHDAAVFAGNCVVVATENGEVTTKPCVFRGDPPDGGVHLRRVIVAGRRMRAVSFSTVTTPPEKWAHVSRAFISIVLACTEPRLLRLSLPARAGLDGSLHRAPAPVASDMQMYDLWGAVYRDLNYTPSGARIVRELLDKPRAMASLTAEYRGDLKRLPEALGRNTLADVSGIDVAEALYRGGVHPDGVDVDGNQLPAAKSADAAPSVDEKTQNVDAKGDDHG